MHSARFNASKSILAESIQAPGLVIGASAVTERDGVLIKDACSSILQSCACRFSLLAASTLDFSSFQATNASKTQTYFQYFYFEVVRCPEWAGRHRVQYERLHVCGGAEKAYAKITAEALGWGGS